MNMALGKMWRSSENTVTLTYKGVAWKWEWSHSVVSNSLRPHGLQPTMEEVPGFSVHGIFQARILEWVAISFSRRSSLPRDRTWISHVVGRRFTVWATGEVLGNPSKQFQRWECLRQLWSYRISLVNSLHHWFSWWFRRDYFYIACRYCVSRI